ncbi:MAG: von Willebrand factor type A domain-containing protein [Opitutaceae bacterium]|jgi:Ca-activated chloride channel family protein
MNHDINETIFPADPRITAYAFGELEGDELARIEAAVQADPELRAAVAELRAFGGQLTAALGDEPAVAEEVTKPAPKKRRGWVIPFPLHYFATAAAACFAVVVWVRHEDATPKRAEPVKESDTPMQTATVIAAAEPAVANGVALPEFKDNMVKFDGSLGLGAGVGAGNVKALNLDGYATHAPVAASAPVPVSRAMSKAELDSLAENKQNEDRAATRERLRAAALSSPVTVKVTQGPRVPEVFFISDSGSRVIAGNAPPEWREVPPIRLEPSMFTSGEAYRLPEDNVYRSATTEPFSTFSIDVDTASYSNVRRFLTGGRLPPRDAVRVEELINYFPYRYTPPQGDVPFAAKLDVASAPWAPSHRLVRIGLKGREFTAGTRPPANLVFLLDVSGSMNSANKLPLVKESLRLLIERLRADDQVAIVTYAGSSGLALPSTPVFQKAEILAALDNLNASGSTNGAMGIQLAYDIAKANFVTGGVNRVILCTDGDFNVGVTDRGVLVNLITAKAKSRVFLSVFGFGMGNLKDSTLESLADKGNGAYGYIDTRREAEKVFVEQAEGTLATIAKDVKIQVEFNPARVQSYRLIGYENRLLKKEDFNNDAVDAGEVGAGHTVTALYEIVPVGLNDDGAARPTVDALKYQQVEARSQKPASVDSPELLTVKIRYKATEGDVSKKLEFPLIDTGAGFAKADGEFRFAAAVAAWGMLLRDSPHKGSATFDQVAGWAEDGMGNDESGYRAEFIQLVRRSAELSAR